MPHTIPYIEFSDGGSLAWQKSVSNAAFHKFSSPDHGHHAFLAAANGEMGDQAAAGAHVVQELAQSPDFSIALYLETMRYARDEERNHHRDALLKAGFQE